VLFNESDDPVTTDLTFLPDVSPTALTDVIAGEQLRPSGNEGVVGLPGIRLERWQTKMFLSNRTPDQAVASPSHWLTLQQGWWQGTEQAPKSELPSLSRIQRRTLDLTDSWSAKRIDGATDVQAATLAQPGASTAGWEKRRLELWLGAPPAGSQRVLLRRSFTVPETWKDGEVAICCDVPYAQFFHQTRVFIDGAPLAGGRKAADGPYWDTLGGIFKPGSVHHIALDIETSCSLMGCRGPIWLSYRPNPASRQVLSGKWDAWSTPVQRAGMVDMPGKINAQFVTRTLRVDDRYRNSNISIRIDMENEKAGIIVNGYMIKPGEQPRCHVFDYAITPLLRFGEDNLIEIAFNSDREKTIRSVELWIEKS